MACRAIFKCHYKLMTFTNVKKGLNCIFDKLIAGKYGWILLSKYLILNIFHLFCGRWFWGRVWDSVCWPYHIFPVLERFQFNGSSNQIVNLPLKRTLTCIGIITISRQAFNLDVPNVNFFAQMVHSSEKLLQTEGNPNILMASLSRSSKVLTYWALNRAGLGRRVERIPKF